MKALHEMMLFIFLGVIATASAQQDPLYSMYLFDKMLINPAFTGSSNWAVATLKDREQFLGLPGRPSTRTLNFHAPLQKQHVGIGFKVISDKIAVETNLNVGALFSYHINFAGGKLSAGLDFGIMNRRINYADLVVSKQGDQALQSNNRAATIPDLSYGFYYQKKQFYLGFSHYHLIHAHFNDGTPVSAARLYSHYYFLAGNVYSISKKVTIEPSVLLKKQRAVLPQVDINATVYYNDVIGLGLQFRTREAIVIFFKLNVSENFKIAYGYDLTVSRLAGYSKGAHEIIISYGIKLPPPPSRKEIHPRYYF